MRVVPDYAGGWSGWYRIKTCTRLSGPGPSSCRFVESGRFGLRTVLTQDGARLFDILDLLNNFNDRVVETGMVDGAIDPGNVLVISGTTRVIDPAESGETTLSQWSTTLTGDGQTLAGTFVKKEVFRKFWGLPNDGVRLCSVGCA